MAELNADDEAALELASVLKPVSSERLAFPGDVRHVLAEFPQSSDVSDAEWIMFEEESVAHAHRFYHDAGASVALTFTDDCSAPRLQQLGVGIRMEDVNSHAARLAFSSASRFVLGALGPSCLDACSDEDEAADAYEKQARVLLSRGVHGLLLEHMPDMRHLRVAAQGATRAAQSRFLGAYRPVLASVVLDSSHVMADGTTLDEAFAVAGSLGIVTLGVEGLDSVGACALSSRIADLASDAGVSALVRIDVNTPRVGAAESAQPDDVSAVDIAASELVRAGVRLIGPGRGAGATYVGVISEVLERPAQPQSRGVELS